MSKFATILIIFELIFTRLVVFVFRILTLRANLNQSTQPKNHHHSSSIHLDLDADALKIF